MRKIALAVMTVLVSTLPVAARTAQAVSTTPAKGSWTWCTVSVQNGCLEAVTTISPTGTETTFTDSASAPADLSVGATCSMNGGTGNACDTNKFQTTANNTCVQRPDWAGGFTTPSVEMDVMWPSHLGWSVVARFSTGDFRPAFLIGHGTTKTRITDDTDGTYTFELTVQIDKNYMGVIGLPGSGNYDPESIATSANDTAHVQLWPRDHLIHTTATPGPCNYFPFSGAWAEANAQGFSWSYYGSGAPALAGTTANTPNTLKFIAYAPHYKPRNGSDPLELVPARVQVFLPTAYFNALGYTSLDEFDASSYSVTTEDGQATTPTATKRDDGILINLGVTHYSAPNPTVTFKVKGTALSSSGADSLPKTTPIVVTSATSSKATPMGRGSSRALSKVINYSGSGSKTWRATGGCTVKGKSLVAPKKIAVCKVTLVVRNAKGKVTGTRSTTIRVA